MADCEHPSFHEQYRDGSGDCVKCAAEELEERLGSVMLERDEKARLLDSANAELARLDGRGGCSSHACLREKPKGMGTNGGKCSCTQGEVRRYIEQLREQADAKHDLREALAKSDLQVDALKKAILYVKAEECLSAKGEGVLDKALQPVAETRVESSQEKYSGLIDAAWIMVNHQKDRHELSSCCNDVTPTPTYLLEMALRGLGTVTEDERKRAREILTRLVDSAPPVIEKRHCDCPCHPTNSQQQRCGVCNWKH